MLELSTSTTVAFFHTILNNTGYCTLSLWVPKQLSSQNLIWLSLTSCNLSRLRNSPFTLIRLDKKYDFLLFYFFYGLSSLHEHLKGAGLAPTNTTRDGNGLGKCEYGVCPPASMLAPSTFARMREKISACARRVFAGIGKPT